jgi:hypothetical protein
MNRPPNPDLYVVADDTWADDEDFDGRPQQVRDFTPESPEITAAVERGIIGGRKAERDFQKRLKVNAKKPAKGDMIYPSVFVGKLREMLESTPYRALSLAGIRVLDCVELAYLSKGGDPSENGRLVVTHAKFKEHGIPPNNIAPGIREAATLGFIAVIESGVAGNERSRKANIFRLTYRPCALSVPGQGGTHDWRQFKEHSLEECIAIAKDARDNKRDGYRAQRGNVNTDAARRARAAKRQHEEANAAA